MPPCQGISACGNWPQQLVVPAAAAARASPSPASSGTSPSNASSSPPARKVAKGAPHAGVASLVRVEERARLTPAVAVALRADVLSTLRVHPSWERGASADVSSRPRSQHLAGEEAGHERARRCLENHLSNVSSIDTSRNVFLTETAIKASSVASTILPGVRGNLGVRAGGGGTGFGAGRHSDGAEEGGQGSHAGGGAPAPKEAAAAPTAADAAAAASGAPQRG
eukprot:CAMPEP_0204544106 /NCGR_PEP_ID=MMETSP0661-20131031/20294_1 /ASSEMBLY_ACC=CAM_ASM_000606 /TAXON_ID=109239 /ORGANISM="Alexandrium margalefi, Strain AMGDE01CS-322" /LENGTH=223 /DNA_ID=CAMNT_0051550859 /DNA_START=156 /DNA_END=825 /DNA_ORIENTATION=+